MSLSRYHLILVVGLFACKSRGAADDRCRKALRHAVEIYEASDAPSELKQQVRDGLDDAVRACQAEKPPAKVLDCTLAAKTLGDLVTCDAMRGEGRPAEGHP